MYFLDNCLLACDWKLSYANSIFFSKQRWHKHISKLFLISSLPQQCHNGQLFAPADPFYRFCKSHRRHIKKSRQGSLNYKLLTSCLNVACGRYLRTENQRTCNPTKSHRRDPETVVQKHTNHVTATLQKHLNKTNGGMQPKQRNATILISVSLQHINTVTPTFWMAQNNATQVKTKHFQG